MIIVVEQIPQTRLDVYLSNELEVTRSKVKNLVDGGHILVDGKQQKCGLLLSGGENISVDMPVYECDLLPQNIPLDVLYEDDHLAVISKQRGLSVHPAGGAVTDTLVNALLFHFGKLSSAGGSARAGIVHRLDKDTTGVMVVAKTDAAHLELSRQIAARSVKKLYHAIVEGVVKADGVVDAPIARSRADRKKMAVDDSGRSAQTGYRVLERFKENSLLELDLLTGRTHQIRVHMRHIGSAVVGDKAYGHKKQRFNLEGQLLHSHYLEFTHPVSGDRVNFTAPYPDDFTHVLSILRRESGM